jgi:hypothetical protein
MITLSELRCRAGVVGAGRGAAVDPGPTVFTRLAGDVAAEADHGLVERFRALDAERRLEAEFAMVVGEVDRRRVWSADAHVNVAAWLRATGNWSMVQAQQVVRRARLFVLASETGDALLDGRCGLAQIDEMARAAASPRCGAEIAGVVHTFVGVADKVSFDDFRLVVRRWETLADADGAHRDREETDRRRRAHVRVGDGVASLSAVGGALAGAEMQEILDRFAKAELLNDRAEAAESGAATLPRTAAQRRFDALHAIFLAAASTPGMRSVRSRVCTWRWTS